MLQVIPAVQQVAENRVAVLYAKCRTFLRQRVVEALFDASRRHRRGRIDAHPAVPLDPDFGPGVGVGLAHDQVVADPIVLAALVAGDDAGRDSGATHDQRKGAGVMLAESAPCAEQEFIDGVASQRRRAQGIDVLLLAKHFQDLVADVQRIVESLRQRLAEGYGSRVVFLGVVARDRQVIGRLVETDPVFQPRLHRVTP